VNVLDSRPVKWAIGQQRDGRGLVCNEHLHLCRVARYEIEGTACNALAAGEVIARLRGRPGYKNAYTEKVDEWVAAHPIVPPDRLVARGEGVITRILGPDSELRELWADAGDEEWLVAVDDLRRRMSG